MTYKDILTFWFEELTEADWFKNGEQLDPVITERFGQLHQEVMAGEHANWRETAKGALAEVIVLDQFSRNIYRGKGQAFAADNQALVLAQVAIARGFDAELSEDEKLFLYMPFMHSESRIIHERAVELFTQLGDEGALKYEKIHKDIIDRFGRYPHRNEQLGRESTPEEIAYLKENEQDFFNA